MGIITTRKRLFRNQFLATK